MRAEPSGEAYEPRKTRTTRNRPRPAPRAIMAQPDGHFVSFAWFVVSTMNRAESISWYRKMQLIRQTEEQLARSYQRGLIHGACHTCVGQEAVPVGVCSNLRRDDVLFSTHRGHGHALAKGLPPVELMAELFGRETGCSRGRGGSMHLYAPEIGLIDRKSTRL